ncbi:MAG: hypothetical protein JXB15_17955 [Anaerolineales bacterium]|nr:hypothetical protein [Anaerolineales bacterium]
MNNNSTINDDERMRILKMIEEGKITAGEGAELLNALNQGRKVRPPEVKAAPPEGSPRWFKISVTDLVTGKHKARVTIPFSLMDWGLKIGAQFAPEIAVGMEDWQQAFQSGVEGKIIDVVDEEDGEHVEIYVE